MTIWTKSPKAFAEFVCRGDPNFFQKPRPVTKQDLIWWRNFKASLHRLFAFLTFLVASLSHRIYCLCSFTILSFFILPKIPATKRKRMSSDVSLAHFFCQILLVCYLLQVFFPFLMRNYSLLTKLILWNHIDNCDSFEVCCTATVLLSISTVEFWHYSAEVSISRCRNERLSWYCSQRWLSQYWWGSISFFCIDLCFVAIFWITYCFLHTCYQLKKY